MPSYKHVKVPAAGQKITVNADTSLNVPDQAIIPYIEGDGTGFDITPVMIKVTNAARLQKLCEEMSDIALEAGGRFYFAKDSTLTPEVAAGYLGAETLRQLQALKRRCDPNALLQTDLYRRLLRPHFQSCGGGVFVQRAAGVPLFELERGA